MVTFNRNILGLGITRQLDQQSNRLSKVFEQLATGKRITTFDVDAAGGGIATRLEAAFRGLSAQISNDQTQINRLQTEEAGLGGIAEELQRIRELQVQAQNAALGPEEVDALQMEVNQRVQNIQGMVENTQFAGNALIEPGSQLAAMLENGVDVTGDPADTDVVLEEVTAERSEIGAEVNALESRVAERQSAFENTVASYSQLADLDLATGVTEQINGQVLQLMSVKSLRNLFVFNRQNALRLLDAV